MHGYIRGKTRGSHVGGAGEGSSGGSRGHKGIARKVLPAWARQPARARRPARGEWARIRL